MGCSVGNNVGLDVGCGARSTDGVDVDFGVGITVRVDVGCGAVGVDVNCEVGSTV